MHKSSLVFNVSSDGFKKRWHDISTSIREVSKAKPEDYSASQMNIALHTIWTLNASNELRISWFFRGGGGREGCIFFLKTYHLLIIRTCECQSPKVDFVLTRIHTLTWNKTKCCVKLLKKKWFACSSVVKINSCGFYISIICYDTPLLYLPWRTS